MAHVILSGTDSQFAIETAPVEIVDLPTENAASFHSHVKVYQRVNPIKSHEKPTFPMVFPWFSYGFPMVFLWFSYGFPTLEPSPS